MKHINKLVMLTTVLVFMGCETGMKNKVSDNKTNIKSTDSGIVTAKGSKAYNKPYIPKSSEIRKIYSKSGVPGYYIQVGYFKEKKPTQEFINRMEFSELPYRLIKKYNSSGVGKYALIGPYISYNKAREIVVSAKEFVTPKAFIVKLVRP
jgi:hypothetical protein